ncbi:MAG: alpha/beta hydrolase family protein [Gammaproteobacteria bacterium]|nr:alpha/beta hydrolase family protein [Gammaproteobacteria bacterium]MDH5513804.1 alpha/beta hydrolase family protein [Gammaproteobacteria bacterium]
MHTNNSLSLLPVATVIFLTGLLPGSALAAADLAREQRLAEQTVDAILDGDPVELDAGEHTFLGIFMTAEHTPAKGAVLVLHGRGTHPDWHQVANPLLTTLPAAGRATLSLQMPVLARDAKFHDYLPVFPEAIPRIDAGISKLRVLGFERIILVAHSCVCI